MLKDGKAATVYLQTKSSGAIQITVADNGMARRNADGTFTTANGDTFTTEGLANMAKAGYTFKVDSDGNLLILSPDKKTNYTSDSTGKPVVIDSSGSISQGKLNDGHGKTIDLTGGKITPQNDGTFKVEGSIHVNSKYNSDFGVVGTDSFSFSFDKSGCKVSTNCVDITGKDLSISNDGAQAALISASYSATKDAGGNYLGPYDNLKLNVDKDTGAPIVINEKIGESVNTIIASKNGIDAVDNIMLNSIKSLNLSVAGEPFSSYSCVNGDCQCNKEGGSCSVNPITGQATAGEGPPRECTGVTKLTQVTDVKQPDKGIKGLTVSDPSTGKKAMDVKLKLFGNWAYVQYGDNPKNAFFLKITDATNNDKTVEEVRTAVQNALLADYYQKPTGAYYQNYQYKGLAPPNPDQPVCDIMYAGWSDTRRKDACTNENLMQASSNFMNGNKVAGALAPSSYFKEQAKQEAEAKRQSDDLQKRIDERKAAEQFTIAPSDNQGARYKVYGDDSPSTPHRERCCRVIYHPATTCGVVKLYFASGNAAGCGAAYSEPDVSDKNCAKC